MKKCFFVLFFLLINYIHGQSLTGLPGLISIPTAEINGDGVLTIGTAYYDKDYLKLYGKNFDGLAFYSSFSFLPFVEVGLRFTRLLKYNGSQALGDRMPSVRFRLIAESKYFPSFLFGAHDFIRTSTSKSSYNTATYFVITKNFSILDQIKLKISAGHGFRLFTSSAYQFEKYFYGSSLSLFNIFELIGENDGIKTNLGMRTNLFNIFSLTIGLMNYNDLCGTSCIMIRI